MFVVRKITFVIILALVSFSARTQNQPFRMGSMPSKSVDEIKKLDGYLKAEETLKLIRNTATQTSPEIYSLIDESLRLAQDAQRADLIGGLLCGKAVLKLQETDTATALQLLEKAENYLKQVSDRRFTDNVLNSLAIGYMRAGNSRKAVEMNQRIIEAYDDIPENRIRRTLAFRNLSNAFIRGDKKADGINAMEKAVATAELTNNETLIQDTKLASAMMYANLNDYQHSFSVLKNVLPAMNRLPPRATEILYVVLADTYQKQGEFTRANEFYKKVVNSSNQGFAVKSYLNLILNSDKTKEKDSVEKYYSALQSLVFANQKTTPQYFLALAKYNEIKGRTGQQMYWLKKAVSSDKSSPSSVEAYISLANYYSEKGAKDSADYYFTAVSQKQSALRKDPVVYSDFLNALKQHRVRYKITDSLISVLNSQIEVRDSLHQTNLFSITKDLETQYKVSEKEFQLQQIAQQRKLDQLQLKEQQQQSRITLLSLAVILVAVGAIAFILYTKRKQSEKIHSFEVYSLKTKHQIELMQALDKAQERERRSIADKLHDEVGAMLSVLKLNLSGAGGQRNVSSTDKSLQTSLNIVDTLAGEIRNLSHTLMPVVVEKYGMIRGIKDLAEQINTSGKLKTELIVSGFENENSIAVNHQMHIYRIVQELMNNIIKHSGATHALVQLVEHPDSVSLVVEDNGKGLAEKNESGNGLHVLKSKILLLNGEMNVESQVGNGTSFIIEIPKNINTPLLYEKNQDNVSG